MVARAGAAACGAGALSVLALSSRFDGLRTILLRGADGTLSVLALSSRFDGRRVVPHIIMPSISFSTRSVESF